MSERLVRAAVVRVLDRGPRTFVMDREGRVQVFAGKSARLLRAVLHLVQHPMTREEILGHLAREAGVESVSAAAVDTLLGVLREGGLVAPVPAPTQKARPASVRRLVLGVSGAVAAMDAPALVRVLQRRGYVVRVALSRAALRFVSARSLAALTHHPAHASLWEATAGQPAPHIDLAEWADAVLVAPASATTLGRIAHGDCSDLVSAVAVATRAPVVVAPSMNPAMYASGPVQRTLKRLRSDGVGVIHPAFGVEVAHAPDARAPVFGPMAPAKVVADLLGLMLARDEGSTDEG